MKSTGVGPEFGIADGELLKERKRAVMAWHQDRRTHKKTLLSFPETVPDITQKQLRPIFFF
jgi:hypothetical protein